MKQNKILVIISVLVLTAFIAYCFQSNQNIIAYQNLDADSARQLFQASYAMNIYPIDLTQEQIDEKIEFDKMVLFECENYSFDNQSIIMQAEEMKLDYLNNARVDSETYKNNYKTLGFSQSEITDFFIAQVKINTYLENTLYDFEINDSEIKSYYNEHLDDFSYASNILVFKMFKHADSSITSQVLANINSAESKDILFEEYIYNLSEDINKKYTGGIYAINLSLANESSDYVNFLIRSTQDLENNEFSSILSFISDNDTDYYIFERLPNTISYDDSYPIIENIILSKKKQAKLVVFSEVLKYKYNVNQNNSEFQ